MPNLSLGLIEVLGLPAAVEAADVACKTADVQLIGYETTDGMGMVAVKIEGQVSAVKAAVAAASAAAARVSKVFATSVIARPSDQLPPIVFTRETVGLAQPTPAPTPAPTPLPLVEPVETIAETTPRAPVEPVETTPPPPVEPAETTPPPPVEPSETTPEVPTGSTSVKPRTPRTRTTKKQ